MTGNRRTIYTHNRQRMLKPLILVKGSRYSLLILGFIVALFVIFLGGRLLYFLLYVYVLGILLPLVHGLIGRFYLTGVVTLPATELVAGEEISFCYRVNNPLRIPFPSLELENQLGNRLTGNKEPIKIFSLQGKDWFEETTSILCKRRGLYETGAIKLHISDIFHLFTFEKVIATPISLKIYPRVTTVDSFHLSASQQMGNLKVRNPLYQDYTEVADLRQYREGDSVKRIHWKISAGKEELMIKHFEERGDTEVLVLLDSQQSHYRDDEEGWVEDQLVEGAAALIDYCLRRNIKVTMTYFKQDKPVFYQGDTILHLKHFLDGLAMFHPLETAPFEKQIEISTQQLSHGTATFFMTPELTKETAYQGISLRLKNQQPQFMVFGDKEKSGGIWQQNREMVKKLEGESITCYLFQQGKGIKEVLEGRHGHGTEGFKKGHVV